jgi:gliding motility-associated-like protein
MRSLFMMAIRPNPATEIGQIGGGFAFSDEGGGGVCYQVQATSGCLTVNFFSDATATFEGFAGQWECTTQCPELVPITVEQDIDDQQIIDFVASVSSQVTITDINCPEISYGTFEAGDNTDLGLERGLVMTSGDVNYALGPNNNAGGFNPNADNFAPGDADLDYLSTILGDNVLSQNACIIELDVEVATNELTFEYVFGSEEYPEFVNSGFNDIFAFLISGPGIEGDPNIGNQLNIAVLPDGNDTPVQINSVNNLDNWEYYRDNGNGQSLQYDGLTSDFLGVKKSLTARAQVVPCSTYHLKFAIADRGDTAYDSGVFISDIKGGTPNLSVKFNSGIDYLVEDCVNQPDEVIIELSNAVDDTTQFIVEIGGTATLGVDYLLEIPDTIIFLPGETVQAYPIETLSDLITEPDETITLALTNNFGCGEVTFTAIEVTIADQIAVEINIPQDTILVCQDSSIVLEVIGAASYFWQPVSVFDNPTSPTPTANPDSSLWVTVEGLVGPCIDFDSVYLQLVDPIIMAEALDPEAICQGDSVRLSVTNNVNDMNLQWTPSTGLDDPNSNMPVASPEVSTEYIVSVDIAGCFVFDTINIDVSPFDFPEVIADTLICENYSVQLASTIDSDTTTTTFVWTPDISLDNDSIAGPIATPQTTTTYILTATSENGACADSADVTVQVFPADVEIQNPDSLEMCLGDTITLTANTSTGLADGLVWSPNDGALSDTLGLSVEASPTVSGWYFSTFTLAQCTVFDSVYIRVDSLPDLTLMADPIKEAYCQGDVVTLSTPAFEPSFYPDIEHLWTIGLGFETPDTLFNMVFTAQDTTIYQRITTNRACTDTAEILINVIQPPIVTITPQDTSICLGESVQFFMTIEGQYDEFTWSGDGLSCTDCFDPVATPASPGVATYNIEITADGCESPVSTSFNVLADPLVDLNTGIEICVGESVQINAANDDVSTYTWTSDDPDFGTTNDPRPVVSPTETTTYFLVADNGVCPPLETQVIVAVIPQASIDVMADAEEICQGEEVMISVDVTNSSNSDAYFWSNSADDDRWFDQSFTDTPNETTTYTLVFTSGEGCDTLTAEVTVVVEPIAVTNIASDTIICLGQSVQLNVDSDNTSAYLWTSDDPNFTDTSNPEPVVTPAQTSTYTLLADNGICPPIQASVTVEVIGNVSLSINGPSGFICSGDEVALVAEVTGGSSGDSFTWVDSNGNTFNGDSILVSPGSTTLYDLTYVSGSNCQTIVDSFLIEVETGVLINELVFEPDTAIYFLGESVDITALYSTALAEGLIFSWFENDSLITSGVDLDQITIESLPEGEPVYSLIIETPTGCTAEISESIIVQRPIIDVPNVFTPNGDQDNEFFDIVHQGARELLIIDEFKVYNRWGQLIYDNDTPATGWDGNFNDRPQPTEAYFYMIRVLFKNGEEAAKFQGNVTLVR